MVWLDFANAFGYLAPAQHRELLAKYEELGRIIGGTLNAPEKFSGH